MSDPFHKRFSIDVKPDEAQRRFLERVRTATQIALSELDHTTLLNRLLEIISFKMGIRHHYVLYLTGNTGFMDRWDKVVGWDFTQCLRMTEAVNDALFTSVNSYRN
jgi:hypothetical protein